MGPLASASTTGEPGRVRVYHGDNAEILPQLAAGSFALIYIDPPFNTGKVQRRTQIRAVQDDEGDRRGFRGQRYRTTRVGTKAFGDLFDDYLEFLAPRLEQAHRLLSPSGSLLLHLDYREVHYAKVLLDQIFGRECFQNEIIWAYDYGARTKKRWSAKHDNILWYVRDPQRYVFNYDEMDRIPYMAPGLVGKKKAARGKTPTDTWWHTIVSPSGKEKTGYPTQKPLGIVRRFVKVHSRPGDQLLDFFAGSGTLGEAGAQLGRDVTLVDESPQAMRVIMRRLARFSPEFVGLAPELREELWALETTTSSTPPPPDVPAAAETASSSAAPQGASVDDDTDDARADEDDDARAGERDDAVEDEREAAGDRREDVDEAAADGVDAGVASSDAGEGGPAAIELRRRAPSVFIRKRTRSS